MIGYLPAGAHVNCMFNASSLLAPWPDPSASVLAVTDNNWLPGLCAGTASPARDSTGAGSGFMHGHRHSTDEDFSCREEDASTSGRPGPASFRTSADTEASWQDYDADIAEPDVLVAGCKPKVRRKDPPAVLLPLCMRLYGLQELKTFRDPQRDAKALLAWNKATMVLSFRGTASFANALLDIKVAPRLILHDSCSDWIMTMQAPWLQQSAHIHTCTAASEPPEALC